MSALSNAIHYVLDLGPAVMMPAFITVLGLLLGQGFARSFRAGLTVGVGFVAIGLVVGLLVGVVGPQAMAFADVLGLKLDVLDVGWPMGAAVSFASPIAAALIPTVLFLNILLVIAKFTRTVDVDLWNYWHFIYAGALVQTATGSLALGMVAACITAVVILKLADWTQPAVEKFFGLPDISLPHTETVNWAPLMFAIDRLARRLPGLSGADEGDPAAWKKRLGVLGEPILMGAMLGLLIGTLGAIPDLRVGHFAKSVKAILTLSVSMAAVLVVLPKVVAILMEGLIPISEGARDYLQRKLPGRDAFIGLDAAVVIGHPANMAIALLCVPLVLLLALVLPGNRMLPFGDLAALPFYVLWGVAAARGHLLRGLVNSVVILCGILLIGTSLAPLTTELARAAHFEPQGLGAAAGHYTQWSGIALGSHVVPWIVLQLFRPGTPGFYRGLAAAFLYAGAWWWARGEVRARFLETPGETSKEKRAP
jgi:PTS system galactitol-specific IIC component